MSNNIVAQFLGLKKIAVVGASNDRSKYGNIVLRKLMDNDYTVYPVNPNASRIEGEICYQSLCDLPDAADGAVLIVPPKVTEEVVKEANAVGLKYIWMQPGAESRAAVKYCSDHEINCISRDCILVQMREKL